MFRSRRAESELAREIQAHLQLLEDQFAASGMTREEAGYAARRAFGGVEQIKERQRDARSFRWLTGWPMDLRLGVRMLARTPGLTVIAVVALAIAMAAGAAYLEFVYDLVRPALASADSQRVIGVRVWDVERSESQNLLWHDVAAWQEARALEAIGAFRSLPGHLITADGRAEAARAVEVSAVVFRLFPDMPLRGRGLNEEDERPDAAPVVVIGADVWQRRFDGDPDVVGRTVRLGSSAYTVVGVMPEAFGFPINQNLWVPLKAPAAGSPRGEGASVQIVGRLRPGVSASDAAAELTGMLPPSAQRRRVEVRPYVDSLLNMESSRVPIEAVLYSGNLLFVLLLAICGANVATLVFARTATREAEITVRTALGATRARICGQLFAEALVLSLVAAVAGLALAGLFGRWLSRVTVDAIGQPLPFWWNHAISTGTILYAVVLAVFAAAIIGVIPALKATGAHLQGRLREAGTGGSTLKFGRLWTTVIVTQVAITTIFLAAVVSVGWTTFQSAQDADVTFAREQILTARLVVEAGAHPEARNFQASYRALADRLRRERGIGGVTYATEMPGTTFGRCPLEFAQPDVASGAVPHEDGLWVRSSRVGPSYFETLAVPLVAGRVFTEAEIAANSPVAVVDETFVRLILGGRSAVGLMVREPPAAPGDQPGPWFEIVGVVADVTVRPRKRSYDSMLYRPAAIDLASTVHVMVRIPGPASSMPLAHTLPAAAASATSDLRLEQPKSLDRVAADEALPNRILARVLTVVAAVALLLSTAGIYALVAFTLARRTREIGIRIALGAAPRRIITSTFSRAFMQVALGVALGAMPGVILVLEADDRGGMTGPGLAVTLGVGAFVIAVALMSCAAPLRRALRIEPMQALRADS